MLAADKLLLESTVKQSAISLKEKEFSLHHGNFNTVGTQAAVLAGFTVTSLIEIHIEAGTPRWLQLAYFAATVGSLGANIMCLACTTFLSVWGTSLGVRGPDGSMARAVSGMYELRKQVFTCFGAGLTLLLLSAVLGSWITMHTEAAAVCSTMMTGAFVWMYRSGKRIFRQFYFDEQDATSFDDLLRGRVLLPKARGAAARSLSTASSQGGSTTPDHHHRPKRTTDPRWRHATEV
eukprot:TRINITY_DN31103_c0_g1_i1.p1 TRINITY_DN31103_c0_g1~~TRINITY_DN31103_c0_g1_i1.p1  ORF type:complete len:235 (+),score=62.88 TRINITY_DN31103_c0_g1_i1:147-851(+)